MRTALVVDYARLEQFYLELVGALASRGVACAITSGMACVQYGVSQTTKDCDLLCHLQGCDALLELLEATSYDETSCAYRGNLSPPLDARWLRGGWTSHFLWNQDACLDVFGLAPRLGVGWVNERSGPFAGPHVVAQMKKTKRPHDWEYCTALGLKMLKDGDSRGWLHVYDADLLESLRLKHECPAELMSFRPTLSAPHDLLRPALVAEQIYWQELDRLRLACYERAVRPYLNAVRQARTPGSSLREAHRVRVACAEEHLEMCPLQTVTLLKEARQAVAGTVRPELLEWLPDVRRYFE